MADLFATLAHRALAQAGVRPRMPSRFEGDGMTSPAGLEMQDTEVTAEPSPPPIPAMSRRPADRAVDAASPPLASTVVPHEPTSNRKHAAPTALDVRKEVTRVPLQRDAKPAEGDAPRAPESPARPAASTRIERAEDRSDRQPRAAAIEPLRTDARDVAPVPAPTVVHRHEPPRVERLVMPAPSRIEHSRTHERVLERTAEPKVEAAAAAPRIDIHIGRIEVRAPSPVAAPPREHPAPTQRPRSLDDLLAARRTAG